MGRYSKPQVYGGNPNAPKKEKTLPFTGKLAKEDLSYLTITAGDEVRFHRDGVLMQGKVEHSPSSKDAMDKVLVFAYPVSSPSTKHSYRVFRYELKPWSIWEENVSSNTSNLEFSYTFLITVNVSVEVANKVVDFNLKAYAQGNSSNEALNSILNTEKFKVVVPNSIGVPYSYNGTWNKLKGKAHKFDVSFRIVKPKHKNDETNEASL